MNDKLERVWREPIVGYSKQYPGICLEELRTKNLRICDAPRDSNTALELLR
jgi:hypothetical protein